MNDAVNKIEPRDVALVEQQVRVISIQGL